MMIAQFDTLKFKKQLTAVGIPQNQAEGLTEAVRDSFQNLATKADLLNSQNSLKNDLIKWMVGLSFIQVGLCLSVVLSFHAN